MSAAPQGRAVARTRRWHVWLALVIGVQTVLWAVSGLYMTAVPLPLIHGNHLLAPPGPAGVRLDAPGLDMAALHQRFDGIAALRAGSVAGRPFLVVDHAGGRAVLDPRSGAELPPLDEAEARRIAVALAAQAHPIRRVELLDAVPAEIRGRAAPVWRVEFEHWNRPTFYLAPVTGELLARRHELWRLFDFLWMLHIMDYEEREDVNNLLLRAASVAGLVLSLAGLLLLVLRLRAGTGRREAPGAGVNGPGAQAPGGTLRRMHRVFALLIGVQVLIWLGSGALMALLDHDKVRGHHVAREVPSTAAPLGQDAGRLAGLAGQVGSVEVRSLRLRPLLDRWVYEVVAGEGTPQLYDARTLAPITLDAGMAAAIARAAYAGPGEMVSVTALTAPVQELRKHTGPVWRADFRDEDATAIYLDGRTGRVLAHRTDSWRLFDIAWMLHIMDYQEREDFNHPLIIAAALGMVWLSLTGIAALPRAVMRQWPRRTRRVRVTVGGGPCGSGRELELPAGGSWFEGLARAGVSLPSDCGGVGDCGRCRITLAPAPPPDEADRRRIPTRRLDQGVRLACRHAVQPGSTATLGGD